MIEMNRQYKRRRDVALQILSSRGRRSDYIPGGAFYLPVDISKSGNDDSDDVVGDVDTYGDCDDEYDSDDDNDDDDNDSDNDADDDRR